MILPEWHERLDELRALGRINSSEVLKLGVRQGLFRADLDLEEIATILQDFMIATHLFHDHGPEKQERIARRIATGFEMLMNGIRSRVVKEDGKSKEQVRA
jgi:hypothetical protein